MSEVAPSNAVAYLLGSSNHARTPGSTASTSARLAATSEMRVGTALPWARQSAATTNRLDDSDGDRGVEVQPLAGTPLEK